MNNDLLSLLTAKCKNGRNFIDYLFFEWQVKELVEVIKTIGYIELTGSRFTSKKRYNKRFVNGKINISIEGIEFDVATEEPSIYRIEMSGGRGYAYE